MARRAPEKRQTRKDPNLLNKSNRVVNVKNTEPFTMIYRISKKRKLHNPNEFTEDSFHNWRV